MIDKSNSFKKDIFTIGNYPKSYGNIKKGFYRLKGFDSEIVDIENIEKVFWEFICRNAYLKEPVRSFKNHIYINSGWEWSVFQKDNDTVIKIPAGIFNEVNDEKYLKNSQFNYKKILEYYPRHFVSHTNFKRENNLNMIEQEWIKGKDNNWIGFNTKNIILLENIEKLLNSSLKILNGYQWVPDFSLKKKDKGFKLRNIIIESNIPKIIDFTSYYDIYRLYPEKTKEEVKNKRGHILEFVEWIKERRKILN